MKNVKGYPVCDGCKYSSLHHCNKFNEACPSFCFGTSRYQVACLACIDEDGYEFGLKEENPSSDIIACIHAPGPENFDLFYSIIKMQEYYPECFYENRKITEIYGAFGGAIWNGRTPNYTGKIFTIQEIDSIRMAAEDLGLSINLTWNNHLVSGTDVYDRFCNAITEIFHNGKHAITVASPELFNYLKEKYPNFKYYQSVIQTTNDKVFNKKDERYDFYLMNRNLNNNWDELLKVPEEERSTIEFLCNDICTPICNRMGHYNIVNACLLNRSDENCLGNYCTVDHDFADYNNRTWPMTIKSEDIDTYLQHGFCHFKLCSRGDTDYAIAYKKAQYLAKPEYFTDVYMWTMARTTQTEEMRKTSAKLVRRSELMNVHDNNK